VTIIYFLFFFFFFFFHVFLFMFCFIFFSFFEFWILIVLNIKKIKLWVLGRKGDVFSFQSQPRTADSLLNTTWGKHQLMKDSATVHTVHLETQSIPAHSYWQGQIDKQIMFLWWMLTLEIGQFLSVVQMDRTCLVNYLII
jgi:hypothetical protein